MYSSVSTKGQINSLLTLKLSCEQPSFHIGMVSSPLTREFHEGRDTYCGFPSTLLLNEIFSRVIHKPLRKRP